MSSEANHRQCRCCMELFAAEYRNAYHQAYCFKPECRRASKVASQRRWLAKAANRSYFCGKENVRRVQQWRKAHPGYWRKKSAGSKPAQPLAGQGVEESRVLVTQPAQTSRTLQDVCLTDHPVFIGLISMISSSTLQEDIASLTRKLEARGRDILGLEVPADSQTAL